MRQDFKAYVLIDSRNRFVPGSLILRKPNQKPASRSNGKWVELVPYICCVTGGAGTPVTLTVPAITAPNSYIVEVESGGLTEGPINTGATTIGALVTYLNTNYSAVGTFVADGTNITFTPTVEGASVTITQGLDGVNVALPTLTGPLPNYHVTFTNNGMTTGDLNSGTTTGAALVAWLTANHSAKGTYTLNGTNVLFKAAAPGTVLAIVAGAA